MRTEFTADDAARLTDAMSDLPKAGADLMVALDLDGTTIGHDTSLSPRVKEAVHAHLDSGTRIILATGRGVDGMMLVAEQLELPDGISVCANGALTFARDATANEPGLNPGTRLLDYVTFNPSTEIELVSANIPEAIMAVEPAWGPRRVSAHFPAGELTGESVVTPLHELAGNDATRLTVRAPYLSADELQHRVDDLGLNGVEYAIGWTAWLDISPEGVTKATALEKLRQQYKLPLSSVLTVGDGNNDIEMLDWAGTGISMGDANDRVHRAANAKTASVEDDGLAIVLEHLL